MLPGRDSKKRIITNTFWLTTPPLHGSSGLLMIACRRGFEALSHLLIGGRVNLTTCVALLEDFQCRGSTWLNIRIRPHLIRRWGHCFPVEPAHQCPDEYSQQDDPERRAQEHPQHHGPCETISPHHNGILPYMLISKRALSTEGRSK